MAWDEVIRIGRRQHGAVAVEQIVALVGRNACYRRLAEERWPEPFDGTRLLPGAPWTPLVKLAAATLAVDDPVLVARESALWLHGVVDRPPRTPSLVVPRPRRRPDLPGIDTYTARNLEPEDHGVRQRLPVTSLPRTYLDLAAARPRRAVRASLIDGVQRRRTTLAEVGRRAARAYKARGRPLLLEVIASLDPAIADSILAQEVHDRLVADGYPVDPEPAVVVTPERILHPDVTMSPYRIAIESDGLGFHADRRSLELDHRKNNAYLVAGWRALRIGWGRYDHDWSGFVAEIEALMAIPAAARLTP